MCSSVRERSEALTPSPASNGRAPTWVVNNNVPPQNHLSTSSWWNTPIDTASAAFTQEDHWATVWGPKAQEWIQCGPHSTCCYPVREKGRRIHWGVWLCLEPREHLVEDWGWPDGKWMEGLLVPRQGQMERRKCKKKQEVCVHWHHRSVWGTVWSQAMWKRGQEALRFMVELINNKESKGKNLQSWFI